MADLLGLGVLAFVGGTAVVGFGRKVLERRRARRALAAHPPLTVDSPEGSTARVTGIARVATQTLQAPLSGRECVVARSRVYVRADWAGYAVRPRERMAMVEFLVDQGADCIVRIEGTHAWLDLSPTNLEGSDGDRRRMLMDELDIKDADRSNPRFEETLVAPGDRVSIAGLVMKDVVAEPLPGERGFREGQTTRLRLAGNAEHPLVIGRALDG